MDESLGKNPSETTPQQVVRSVARRRLRTAGQERPMTAPRARSGASHLHVRPLAIAAALCCALVWTAGCSDDGASPGGGRTAPVSATAAPAPSESPGQGEEDPLTLATVDDGRGRYAVVATSDGDPSGDQVLAGELIIADQGCHYISTQRGAPVLLVLPGGTAVDGAERPSIVLEGTSYAVGTPVSFVGAGVQLDEDQRDQARPCVDRGAVFRVAGSS